MIRPRGALQVDSTVLGNLVVVLILVLLVQFAPETPSWVKSGTRLYLLGVLLSSPA